jgi:CDP-glycerol glycerophosphotransferase
MSHYKLIWNVNFYKKFPRCFIKAICDFILKFNNRKIFKQKISENCVCLFNLNGSSFGDNPKYIALELLKRKNFEVIWFYSPKQVKDFSLFPEGIRLVPMNSQKFLYFLSKSKFLIGNIRLGLITPPSFIKQKDQIYIQTWHGQLGLKRVESQDSFVSAEYIELAKGDSQNMDLLIAGTKWCEEEVFNTSFFYTGKYFREGSPRNDILISMPKSVKTKVKKEFNIEDNTKILLYAPTYRYHRNLNVYDIDYAQLKKTLESKFGGRWVILCRLHPQQASASGFLPKVDYIINASQYPDMQELLASADCVISDYSSCIFDYLLCKKPAFIYS